MSPSPSQVSAPIDLVRKATHSRHNSTTIITPGDPSRIVKPQSPSKPVHYTCLIRLPFIRNGFDDPPIVQWDAVKDRALWKLISHASNSRELDWEDMSIRFNVSLAFLLQQAAWLYERHFTNMKAQMKKLGSASMAAGGTSPVTQADGAFGSVAGAGSVPMQRVGSKESRIQALINPLTANRDAATYSPIGDVSTSPGTPRNAAPPISRTPSSATVTQSKVQNLGHSRSQHLQRAVRGSSGSERRPQMAIARPSNDPYHEDAIEHEGPFASDSEEEASALARSRALRRAPIQRRPKPTMGLVASDGDGEEEDDDDDDDSGGYLPFATTSSKPTRVDPAATLKGPPKKTTTTNAGDNPGPTLRRIKTKDQPSAPTSSSKAAAPKSPTDSESSAAMMHRHLSSSGTDGGAELVQRPPPGPISPRHRAQLASLSPRYRREGSEGSPSMGSSFSDLDDASVTQSALEDALLSNMRQGNFSSMASRMSSLRDALGR